MNDSDATKATVCLDCLESLGYRTGGELTVHECYVCFRRQLAYVDVELDDLVLGMFRKLLRLGVLPPGENEALRPAKLERTLRARIEKLEAELGRRTVPESAPHRGPNGAVGGLVAFGEVRAAKGKAEHYHIVRALERDGVQRFACPAPWPPSSELILAKVVPVKLRCGREGCRSRWPNEAGFSR